MIGPSQAQSSGHEGHLHVHGTPTTLTDPWIGVKRVRNLQKLMLRSRSNALVAVRRVTEINAGRKTAGVDGVRVVESSRRPTWSTGCNTAPHRGHRGPSSGSMCPRATGAAVPSGYR